MIHLLMIEISVYLIDSQNLRYVDQICINQYLSIEDERSRDLQDELMFLLLGWVSEKISYAISPKRFVDSF